jgi:hypothetical protein
MSLSVFVELEFWLLVALSVVVPVAIYWGLLVTRAVSQWTVLVLGLALVLVAAVDLYLLQHLAAMARATASLADDAVFASEITIGLYVLPALFAGVGVNVISHVLVRHVTNAENRFDSEHPGK